jgi:serine/threonine protein kinase
VVLKLIKEDRVHSKVAVAEFDAEEQVLCRVRHPNIIRLLGEDLHDVQCSV